MENPRPRPVSVLPSRRPARWKKPLLTLGLLAGALLVSAVLVSGHKWYLMYVGLYEPTPPPAPPEEGPGKQRAVLATIFQDAKNLIRESKWTEAKARLLELQAMAPDYPSLSDYLQKVEQEITNQEHLTAARAALAQKKLQVTQSELDKVRSDTLMYEQVAQLRKELQDTGDARVREARNLYDLNKQAEAIAIVEDVVAVFPKNEDARTLLRDAFSVRSDGPFPPPEPPKPTWEQAVSRFAEGDISGAIAIAESCAAKFPKCKSRLKDMNEFLSLWKKLEDLDTKGISRLLDLDKRLMQERGPSKPCRTAVQRAPILYKEASAAREKGQWARAVEYARRTLQLDPSHTGATTLLKELKTQAEDVYRERLAPDASPEDAIPKLRQVLDMTEPDDELHQKVKRWLEKVSR